MDFEQLLAGSAKEHGHLCPGQVIGVRMSMLGLQLIGLNNTRTSSEIKKLIVYVEIDRCATDAISYVTGVKPGRRSLKIKDYGIMAATFINLETNKAIRIVSTEESRELSRRYTPHIPDMHTRQLEAYKIMPLAELFEIHEVSVDIPASDMPGPSAFKAECEDCGIIIRDRKEIIKHNRILCHGCAETAYYKVVKQIDLQIVENA